MICKIILNLFARFKNKKRHSEFFSTMPLSQISKKGKWQNLTTTYSEVPQFQKKKGAARQH